MSELSEPTHYRGLPVLSRDTPRRLTRLSGITIILFAPVISIAVIGSRFILRTYCSLLSSCVACRCSLVASRLVVVVVRDDNKARALFHDEYVYTQSRSSPARLF
jgi:hypothetical protein